MAGHRVLEVAMVTVSAWNDSDLLKYLKYRSIQTLLIALDHHQCAKFMISIHCGTCDHN